MRSTMQSKIAFPILPIMVLMSVCIGAAHAERFDIIWDAVPYTKEPVVTKPGDTVVFHWDSPSSLFSVSSWDDAVNCRYMRSEVVAGPTDGQGEGFYMTISEVGPKYVISAPFDCVGLTNTFETCCRKVAIMTSDPLAETMDEILSQLDFAEINEYVQLSNSLNRETGTWIPLYLDKLLFSDDWSWPQHGASIDMLHALSVPLSIPVSGGEQLRTMSSTRIIEIDTSTSSSGEFASTACIHSKSPLDLMDRLRFRVSVESTTAATFDNLVFPISLRVDASNGIDDEDEMAYVKGTSWTLGEACPSAFVTSLPITWPSSWTNCEIDLRKLNEQASYKDRILGRTTQPWDTICWVVSPGVHMYIDHVVADVSSSSADVGSEPAVEEDLDALLAEFLESNGLMINDGKVVSSAGPPEAPSPPRGDSLEAYMAAHGMKIVDGIVVPIDDSPSALGDPYPITYIPTFRPASPTQTPKERFECWIEQEQCDASPNYIGLFRDFYGESNFNASVSSLSCMQRAEDYYTFCENDDPSKPTQAIHYPTNATAVFPAATLREDDEGCFIHVTACPANPRLALREFRDEWAEKYLRADVDETACLDRAEAFFWSCGGDTNPLIATATFRRNDFIPIRRQRSYPRDSSDENADDGANSPTTIPPVDASRATDVTDVPYTCHIVQNQCSRGGANYVGTFVEAAPPHPLFTGCDQDSSDIEACLRTSCLKRARRWHQWCENPTSTVTTAWHEQSGWFSQWPVNERNTTTPDPTQIPDDANRVVEAQAGDDDDDASQGGGSSPGYQHSNPFHHWWQWICNRRG